jgi:hypothetical protein
MLSKCLMLASLVCVWSCSDDKGPGGNVGAAGSESAGSAGRAQGGASASGGGAQAGESAAGHGGLATAGAMMGGAAGVAGSSSNLGGASGAGLGGAAAGASGGDENPYGACVGEDATDNSCPVPGSVCHADFGCQPPCPTGTVSCPEPPGGGNASPYCQQRLCRLDCGFGKTCPVGMACDTSSAFCTSNGL